MKFQMIHENYNVANLEKSMDFYEKALGLRECRRKDAAEDDDALEIQEPEDSTMLNGEITGAVQYRL